MTLVHWLSKKQPTIETSVFGEEFVALKHLMEALRGIHYKLRMMGLPLCGFYYVYGDSMSVTHNTQQPESTLRNKSNYIYHHSVCESVAIEETKTAHISTHDNGSDLLTKVLYRDKRKKSVSKNLYEIYDWFVFLQDSIHCIWIKLEGMFGFDK